MHCFLDDSGKESATTNPVVVMAGYFGQEEELITLLRKWQMLLVKHGISGIHMKDLIPIEGEYKRKGWDIPKRDYAVIDFIDAIRSSNVIGIGIAIDAVAFRAIKKKHSDVTIGSAQEFCFQRVLRRIIDRLEEAKFEGKLSVYFDRDPEYTSNRVKIFNWVMQEDIRARNTLVSLTFADVTYYPGLQCADMLAWETRKNLIRRDNGIKSTGRWERMFEAMPEYQLDYIGEEWTAEELEAKMMPLIKEMRANKRK